MKNVNYFRNDFEYIISFAKNKKMINNFKKYKNTYMKFNNIDNDPKGP
ncbi:UNVERIFIED_CONTAM: hypothetical protein O8I53_09350 [Campylobacter lari]